MLVYPYATIRLESGDQAGTESRSKEVEQACRWFVPSESTSHSELKGSGRRKQPYAMVDLRVDLHPEPVAELRRLADAYFPLVPYYNLRPRDPNVPSAAEWLAARSRR